MFKVIFLLGGPGSGKGTQGKAICECNDSIVHISAGDCLREERNKSDSQYGSLIEDCIVNGALVPGNITAALLLRKMEESGKSIFIIDGFPRSFDNLQVWEQVVGDQVTVVGCLYFDCSEDEMCKRCLARSEGRSDDNEQSLRKRFVTFRSLTLPIIEHFEKEEKLEAIDASQEVEDVTRSILKALGRWGL